MIVGFPFKLSQAELEAVNRPLWDRYLLGGFETDFEERFRALADATTVINYGLNTIVINCGLNRRAGCNRPFTKTELGVM